MRQLAFFPLSLTFLFASACADGTNQLSSNGGGSAGATSTDSGGSTGGTTSPGGSGGSTATGGTTTTDSTTTSDSTTTTSTGTDFMLDPASCQLYLCEGDLPIGNGWPQLCGYEDMVNQVLAIFPFCSNLWSDPCSMAAEWLGAPCQSTRMCTHRACEAGMPLNPGCDVFEIGNFCDTHASCCTVAWTEQCVTDWEAVWMGASPCSTTCQGPSPAGCLVGNEWACAPGYQCVASAQCKPSVCACNGLVNGEWLCTPDCGGGECVPM